MVKAGVEAQHRRSTERELLALQSALDDLGEPDKLRSRLVATLLGSGVEESQLEEATSFLSTDCGAQACHYCAIGALAPSPERGNDIRVLKEYVRSLLALRARQERAHHALVSETLVRIIVGSVQQVTVALKRQGPEGRSLAAELAKDAKHQRDLQSLMFPNQALPRQQQMIKLAANVSAAVEEDVARYLETYLVKTDTLLLPTLSETIPAPFDKSFVDPSYATRDGSEVCASDILELRDLTLSRRHVVILGDPGAGKSTSLQALGRHMAKDAARASNQLIPFQVTLRHFVRQRTIVPDLDFVRYAATYNETKAVSLDSNEISYLLHVGRAAFLFDGLDEILDFDERQQITESIHALAQAYPTSVFVVSARSAGYSTAPIYRFDDVLMTQPFTELQVSTFVQNILEVLPVSGVEGRTPDKFMSATKLNSDLRSNPLLLGVMCSMYAAGRTVPSNRAELYAKCAEMIFESWDDRKSISVPFEYVQAAELAVRGLALEIFRAGREEFSARWLSQYLESFYAREEEADPLTAERFARDTLALWRGRKWILVFVGVDQDGIETFRFSHRSFLEYFAAQEMVFLSADGHDLFKSTQELMRSRSGVEFILIAVEMLSARTVNAGTEFIQAGVDVVSSEGQYSDLERLNVCITLVEALPSARVKTPVVEALVEVGVALFIHTIPYLSVEWFRSAQRVDSVAFLTAFDGRGMLSFGPDSVGTTDDTDYILPPWAAERLGRSERDDDWDEDDELEDEYIQPPTMGDTSRLLSALEDLRERDRLAALSSIRQIGDSTLARDNELGLRFAMTLQQLPVLDSWSQVDPTFSEMVGAAGRDLWRAGCIDATPEWLESLDDFWVLLHFICAEGCGWGALGEACGPAAYFVGGWPLSTLTQFPAVPAHWAVIGLLGIPWHMPESSTRDMRAWSREDSARLTEWFARFTFSPWGRGPADDMVAFPLDVVQGDAAAKTSPSASEIKVAMALLIAIERNGDAPFVRAVRTWAEGSGDEALVSMARGL